MKSINRNTVQTSAFSGKSSQRRVAHQTHSLRDDGQPSGTSLCSVLSIVGERVIISVGSCGALYISASTLLMFGVQSPYKS